MKYRYIKAWGEFLGSDGNYIREQLELAAKENAPEDAIYRAYDGHWARYSEMASMSSKLALERIVDRHQR